MRGVSRTVRQADRAPATGHLSCSSRTDDDRAVFLASSCSRIFFAGRALNVSRSYSLIFGLLMAALTCALPKSARRLRGLGPRGE